MPAKNKKGVVSTSHAQPKVEPVRFHHDEGKKALVALAPELAKIKDSELVSVRIDVESAVLACKAVAKLVKSPQVYARFARLPGEELDRTALDGLEQACSAAMFAFEAASTSGALESEAKIAEDISSEAAEVEGRMQMVCEYHLSDDREMKPLLDLLRPGTGHRDLAHDLNGYAKIYEARHAVVSADTKHYRAGDAARAKELAMLIQEALSDAMSHDAREAYSAHVRSWTLTFRRYEEVRAAGLWLFRADPAKDELFPSLFAVGRPNGGRPRKSLGIDAGQPVEGNPAPAAPVDSGAPNP